MSCLPVSRLIVPWSIATLLFSGVIGPVSFSTGWDSFFQEEALGVTGTE